MSVPEAITYSPEVLLTALRGAVGAEHVQAMAGPQEAWRVVPGTPGEIAAVIRVCASMRVAVHPAGSGRQPTVVAHQRPRVEISTRRLCEVLQLDEVSLLVHVQAGLTGNELEALLVRRGLSIGDYPPAFLGSSLGGILAVRTPGKSNARHGFFEDAMLGVSAVLADGRTVHTRVAPRRATGPDLARALCGSEGTIGFITSVVLRIHRKPEARFVSAYVLPSLDAAIAAAYLALREEAQPTGLRVYDAAGARAHFDIGLHGAEALMVAATAGPTDLAACDRDLIASAVRAEGGEAADEGLADLWWARLHAGEPTPGPAPSLQVMAPPPKIRDVYAAVVAAVEGQGGITHAHIARFDADGAVIFFTLTPTTAEVRGLAQRVAAAAGGWPHGARVSKLDPYLRALQAELDPLGIMNPGALAALPTP